MTICRSKLALVIGAVLSLASCAEFGTSTSTGVTRFDIMEGHVRVSTPRGYCVDTRSSRTGFVLAARCDRLGVKGRFAAHEIAIVTVTAAPAAGAPPPDPAVLASLASKESVLEASARGGLALVRLKTDPAERSAQTPFHWRGAFEVRGHLVGLTLYAPKNSTLTGSEGARLLADFADAIQKASRALPKPLAPAKSRRPSIRQSSKLVRSQRTSFLVRDAA